MTSYSQSQTKDRGGVVKVVDHFIVGCVVHLHMPENKQSALDQSHVTLQTKYATVITRDCRLKYLLNIHTQVHVPV